MPLSVGVVGMPNVGKSTLFNAVTRAGAEVSNYPFCTIDRNIGVTEVPDGKLWQLNDLLRPTECIPTTIQFVDIAGLVRGASQGEGLGNTFLGHVRGADALIHVIRCFEDPSIAHVDSRVDPLRDMEVVSTELALADLETAEKGVGRFEKAERANERGAREMLVLFVRIRDALATGTRVGELALSREEAQAIRGENFLTAKPMLYVANADESDVHGESERVRRIKEAVGEENVLPISAKIEEEISQLPEDEQAVFLKDLGLEETGLNRLILAGYRLLNLITFYTIANDKLRAWQVVRGTKAPEAAGKIHSDMEQGFIRAEVMSYEDVMRHRTMAALHRHGVVRTEGKEYEIQDEDVVHFLFN